MRIPLLILLFACTGLVLQAAPPSSSKDKFGREPEQVFLLYVHSCKVGEIQKAAGMVWLREGKTPEQEAFRFKQVQQRIKSQKWETRVIAKAVDYPYAAIVFTTRPDKSDPEPVLLKMIGDEWKLHHQNVSGGLSHISPESHMAKVTGLLRWGNDTTTKLRKKAQSAR